MTLLVERFVLGPLENNAYLLCDEETLQAAIIDSPIQGQLIVKKAQEKGWKLSYILITHAHFDHFATAVPISQQFSPPLPVYLHADDLTLWRSGGGSAYFGIEIENKPEPSELITHGQKIFIGNSPLEVRHTPGHSPGHVIYYAENIQTAFCGDLIFRRSIGRTDLMGGNYQTLVNSIRTQIFSLPGETRLLPGHGDETTPREEIAENPFLF